MTNTAAYWYMTLLVEFYLVFPLVIRFFRWFGPAKSALAVCVLCWGGLFALQASSIQMGALWGGKGSMLYFNLPARLPEFALGMWLAAAWKPYRRRGVPMDLSYYLFALGMALFAVINIKSAPTFSAPAKLMYEVCAALSVFNFLFFMRPTTWLGEQKIVRTLAIASYSLFLVHQPILSYLETIMSRKLDPMSYFVSMAVIASLIVYYLAIGVDLAAAATLRFLKLGERSTESLPAAVTKETLKGENGTA